MESNEIIKEGSSGRSKEKGEFIYRSLYSATYVYIHNVTLNRIMSLHNWFDYCEIRLPTDFYFKTHIDKGLIRI